MIRNQTKSSWRSLDHWLTAWLRRHPLKSTGTMAVRIVPCCQGAILNVDGYSVRSVDMNLLLSATSLNYHGLPAAASFRAAPSIAYDIDVCCSHAAFPIY